MNNSLKKLVASSTKNNRELYLDLEYFIFEFKQFARKRVIDESGQPTYDPIKLADELINEFTDQVLKNPLEMNKVLTNLDLFIDKYGDEFAMDERGYAIAEVRNALQTANNNIANIPKIGKDLNEYKNYLSEKNQKYPSVDLEKRLIAINDLHNKVSKHQSLNHSIKQEINNILKESFLTLDDEESRYVDILNKHTNLDFNGLKEKIKKTNNVKEQLSSINSSFDGNSKLAPLITKLSNNLKSKLMLDDKDRILARNEIRSFLAMQDEPIPQEEILSRVAVLFDQRLDFLKKEANLVKEVKNWLKTTDGNNNNLSLFGDLSTRLSHSNIIGTKEVELIKAHIVKAFIGSPAPSFVKSQVQELADLLKIDLESLADIAKTIKEVKTFLVQDIDEPVKTLFNDLSEKLKGQFVIDDIKSIITEKVLVYLAEPANKGKGDELLKELIEKFNLDLDKLKLAVNDFLEKKELLEDMNNNNDIPALVKLLSANITSKLKNKYSIKSHEEEEIKQQISNFYIFNPEFRNDKYLTSLAEHFSVDLTALAQKINVPQVQKEKTTYDDEPIQPEFTNISNYIENKDISKTLREYLIKEELSNLLISAPYDNTATKVLILAQVSSIDLKELCKAKLIEIKLANKPQESQNLSTMINELKLNFNELDKEAEKEIELAKSLETTVNDYMRYLSIKIKGLNLPPGSELNSTQQFLMNRRELMEELQVQIKTGSVSPEFVEEKFSLCEKNNPEKAELSFFENVKRTIKEIYKKVVTSNEKNFQKSMRDTLNQGRTSDDGTPESNLKI